MNSVVDLGTCRDLLKLSDALRHLIISGQAQGAAVCVKTRDGMETVLFAGDYRDDPEAALKAAMAISWEITKKSGSS